MSDVKDLISADGEHDSHHGSKERAITLNVSIHAPFMGTAPYIFRSLQLEPSGSCLSQY